MARLPEYRPLMDPAAGTRLDLPRANAGAFGAQVGDALMTTGQRLQSLAEARQRQQQQRDENAALTDAARRAAELEAQIERVRMEARETAAADGAGHADAVLGRFDRLAADLGAEIQTDNARQWWERQIIRARGQLDSQEFGFEAGLRAQKVVDDFSSARDLSANNLFTNPSREALDAKIESFGAIVDQLQIPAGARSKLKSETREAFGMFYALGRAERDPYGLRQEIDQGELNDIVRPQDLARIRNAADREIRGIQAQMRASMAATTGSAGSRSQVSEVR
ncbi:MAG: hypothetical protein ACK40H_05155 [Sphingomonadaceae bacterium]